MIVPQLLLPRPYVANSQEAGGFSVAAYGGMSKTVDDPIGTLGATFVPIDTYTINQVAPRFITTNLAAGTISINRLSVYSFSLGLDLAFDELNASRVCYVRMYDVVGAVAIGDTVPIFIGRNTPGIQASFNRMVQIVTVGRAVQIQIGGGDDFTNASIVYAAIAATGVGT